MSEESCRVCGKPHSTGACTVEGSPEYVERKEHSIVIGVWKSVVEELLQLEKIRDNHPDSPELAACIRNIEDSLKKLKEGEAVYLMKDEPDESKKAYEEMLRKEPV